MRVGVLVLGFLTWVILLGISSAQPITELLKEYEEASELYRKTRKESLGHVIIFRREDLERMQAYRLADVLRSLRFFTLSNNRFGILTLNEYGGQTPIPKHIRLYINDHEVSSLHTGSPFLVWENFPIDIVEHIEIYQGIGAIELGNEPATLILKIYTKEPARENARTLRGSLTSRRGYGGVFYSAEEVSSSFSYIFLISDGSDNRKNYTLGGQKLSRDAFYRYAFLGLYFERAKLELGYGFVKKKPFMGFALDGVAEEGYTKAEDIYLSLTAYLSKDRSMKAVFSIDNHRRKHYEKSSSGLFIPVFFDPDPLKNPKDFYENAFFNKVDLYLSKEFRSKENKLLTAVSYKLYNSNIDSRRYTRLNGDVVNVGSTVPFNRQEIYSLILEDQLSLSERNLLIGGIKIDKYYRNGGFEDFLEYIVRAGYISVINENLSVKGFISKSYIPPYFYDTEISGRDLDPMEIPFSVSVEGMLKYGRLNLSLGGSYVRVEKAIVPDSMGLLTNSDRTIEAKPVFLSLDYLFSERGKLSAGVSSFIDPDVKTSPTFGGFVRVLASIRRFDLFSELVYRNGYTFRGKRVSDGYDLSAGVSYRIWKDLSVKLKGENLLGKASETPYLIYQTGDVVSFPVSERTLYLSVDWVF